MEAKPCQIRKAHPGDIPEIDMIMMDSSRRLAKDFYTAQEIESALGSAWAVDTQLIVDGTYFVVECGPRMVGCGGWSRRRTLFGGDKQICRSAELLDPRAEPARIRAFFIHPDWARKGIGRALLVKCEGEARLEGFQSLELVATLSGQRFYESMGFEMGIRKKYPLPDGVEIEFISMRKQLD